MDTGAASGSSSSKINRTLVEKERRMRLRNLYSQLSSLLPPQPRKMSTHDVLEQATLYINQLRKRVEELKQMKLQLQECKGATETTSGPTISPVINISDLDSTLEVNLITGWDGKFKLSDIIKVLMEEGAEVKTVAANHNAGDRTIYSICCRVYFSSILIFPIQYAIAMINVKTLLNLTNLFL
ncbi:hypothetical protein QUC31_014269 [Theobroma cacao]